VSELQQVSRSHKVDSTDIHLFFKSLRDVTLLIKQQLAPTSIPSLFCPFELDELQRSRISLPVVRLAEECIQGDRDGFYEVYCGLGLMRSLVSSPDHVETFNEEGAEKVLGIVVGIFKGQETFCPALLKYRASVLLFEMLSYAGTSDKILSLQIEQLEKKSALDGSGKEESMQKVSKDKSRSRSRSKDRRKKELKRRSEEDNSNFELEIL
jgi:hypothetical protein